MSILLDEKERRQIPVGFHYLLEYKEELDWLLRIQAKKIYEWGKEVCSHGTLIDGSNFIMRLRRECQECWQELLKEIG